MKKDLDQPIKTLAGEPLRDGGTPGGEILTMKTVISSALLTGQDEANKNPSGEEKTRRYRLAMRLFPGGEVDLSPEDLTLIKQLVGAMFLPLVVGQVFAWCDS